MPPRHTILTEHRRENGEQITEKTVERADGETATFSGPTGGPYEYEGDGDPPAEALVALYEHVDKAEIAHERPAEDGEE